MARCYEIQGGPYIQILTTPLFHEFTKFINDKTITIINIFIVPNIESNTYNTGGHYVNITTKHEYIVIYKKKLWYKFLNIFRKYNLY